MTKTITLPGLIDPHVHLRDPGQTDKEDFYSGTSAALAGGYTTVLDMPNNIDPITDENKLGAKAKSAKSKIVCDVGLIFGTLGDNLDQFSKVIDKVAALKIYLNVTTGNFIIDKDKLAVIYRAWPGNKPIMLHAEDDVSDLVMGVLEHTPKTTHVCHVSSQRELEFVIGAKEKGLPVTCGVTPHHLFLSEEDRDRLGPFGLMKPYLKSKKDQNFLWNHMDYIDIIESDHAPHTKAQKLSNNPPFGVPGLETTLVLMLTAVSENRISLNHLIEKLHLNPAKIFSIPTDASTKVVVSMGDYMINNENLKTKAGWSPFDGQKVVGKVKEVVIRGKSVFADDKILASPGSGSLIEYL